MRRFLFSRLVYSLLLLTPLPALAWMSVIRQGPDSTEVPNTDDHFGRAVCAGDFNGDGYDDLATAAPDESNGLINSAAHGMVVISPGSPRGITTQNVRTFSVGDLGTEAARFGRALASGDFNQDGYDDLAVGIPQLNNFGGNDRGAVWIYAGSAGGLQLAPYLQIMYNDVEIFEQDYANFGWALAVGDFDDDGYPDLATSSPGQDNDTGVLYFFFGGAGGLTTSGMQKMYPYTVGGSTLSGGRFGHALAAGQLDGEFGDDLVIGAPETDVGHQQSAGRVYFYFSASNGISDGDAYFLDASNLPSGLETIGNAHLGFSVALGRTNSNGSGMQVAVGAPEDDQDGITNAGVVYPIGFRGTGPTHYSLSRIRQYASYGATDPQPGDQFGYALAMGRFDSDEFEDLAVGAPYEDVTEQAVLGEQSNAGIFHILPGGPGGLSMMDSRTFDHTTINNFVRAGDNLGAALCFGKFEDDSRMALAVGAPSADYVSYESGVPTIFDTGEVFIVAPWRQPQNRPHRTSVLLDCDGYILHAQRPFQKTRPASTTKTVTLLLACEAIWDGLVDPQQFYTVPAWVATQVGGSQTPLVTGEQLSFVGLMQTMMTVSGNDSAMLIGSILSGDGGPWEGWGGTSPLFADMMNDRLDQMGLSSATEMTNAAGIDNGNHYVTALDWATLAYVAIQNECVRTIVDTSPWIVERVLPAGSTMDWFQFEPGGGQPVSMYEAFFPGWVNGVKTRYNKAVGIKPGGTPGGWSTGLSAAEPFGSLDGIAVASTFGSRRNDAPVEGVQAGCSTCLNAELLQYAEGFCSNGNPTDFAPTPDPGPQPWGTLTGIPGCPEEGVHSMTVNLNDELTTAPGRVLQVDLMRGTHVAERIQARQMVKRNSQILMQPGESVNFGVEPFEASADLEISNDGELPASFLVTWGSSQFNLFLQPGDRTTLPAVEEPMPSFQFSIEAIGSTPQPPLGIQETYLWDVWLADGIQAPDYHSVRLTRDGTILAENLSTYVQGRSEDCGDDTFDLVARADDGIPTSVGDGMLPAAPAAIRLLPAYPNPFNPSTTIRFDLPRAAAADLAVYDLRGRLVRTLLQGEVLAAGRHSVTWNGIDETGRTVASGVYTLKLIGGGEVQIQRLTLLK